MKKLTILALVALVQICSLHAQVKIGGINASLSTRSILELESDSLAMLITRLDDTQRDAVTSWEVGHIIFNLTESCFQFYDGTNWECIINTVQNRSAIKYPAITNSVAQNLSPESGLTIYNSTLSCLQVFNGTRWECLHETASPVQSGPASDRVSLSMKYRCGCDDDSTVNMPVVLLVTNVLSSSQTASILNNKCGFTLRYSLVATINLPAPSGYAGKYFCIELDPGVLSLSASFVTSGSLILNPTISAGSLALGLTNSYSVGLNLGSNYTYVVKLYSNGNYWSISPFY